MGWKVLAEPWWVNLLILIPLYAGFSWRRSNPQIACTGLGMAGLFAAAFGFVEPSVVIYLRAASGLLPGYHGSLGDVIRNSGPYYQWGQPVTLPSSLLTIEIWREGATMLMLIAVSLLAASRLRERWTFFLWMFAIWDIAYYLGLWATIRWPASLRDSDVLFLVPVPWIAQVWFPVLVSSLTIATVAAAAARSYRATRTKPVSRFTPPSSAPV